MDKNLKQLIKLGNKISDVKKTTDLVNITSINQLAYATAAVITETKGIKLRKKTVQRKTKQPRWKENLEKEIQRMRDNLSVLTKISNGNQVNEENPSKYAKSME